MKLQVSRVYRCTDKEECGIVLQILHTPVKDKDDQYIGICPVCGGDIDYAYIEQRKEFEEAMDIAIMGGAS